MIITNAQYVTDFDSNKSAIKTTIDDKISIVPLDPDNRHYKEIMLQVESGDLTIEEAE